MQTLTVKEVAETALAKFDQLGAVRGHTTCRYIYPDDSRCIIGLCLNEEVLAKVRADVGIDGGHDGFNVMNVGALRANDLVDYAEVKPGQINVPSLQNLHDALARRSGSTWGGMMGYQRRASKAIAAFVDKHYADEITVETLKEFLVLVAALP
jgi:hypothetical protein